MTREEVISNLKAIKSFYGDDRDDGYVQEFVAMDKEDKEAIDIAIEALQSQQPKERPKGEWIKKRSLGNVGVWECPFCGSGVVAIEQELANYNFCLNCGARMDGKEQGDE